MSVATQLAKVRAAQWTAERARHEVAMPAEALLARGRAHPLAAVGTAAGVGVVLGALNVHPLRVPGTGALLAGGLAEIVALGGSLLAGLGGAQAAHEAHDGFADDRVDPATAADAGPP